MEEAKEVNGVESFSAFNERKDAEESPSAPAEGSSPEPKQETEPQTGEVEKTQDSGTDELADVKEGQPIPFPRFKQVNDKYKALQAKEKQWTDVQAELEELRGHLSDPEVLALSLKKQGLKDEQIRQVLKDRNMRLPDPKLEAKGDAPDEDDAVIAELEKIVQANPDDPKVWLKAMLQAGRITSERQVKPILQSKEEENQAKQDEQYIAESRKEAEDVGKELGIPFGEEGKDDANPKTVIGMIASYLKDNQNKTVRIGRFTYPIAALGYAGILRYALQSHGIKLGEKQGLEKAEKMNEVKKRANMETDSTKVGDERPSADWSFERYNKYLENNPQELERVLNK